jgi:hypothetical protein
MSYFVVARIDLCIRGGKASQQEDIDPEKYMTLTEISEEQCICISRHYVLCYHVL